MPRIQSADPMMSALFAAVAALAVGAAGTAGVALAHIWTTSQRGVICGLDQAGDAHCWACYAAPLLALAALSLWRATERRLVRVAAKAPRAR